MSTEDSGETQHYAVEWNEQERALFNPVIDAVRSGSRENVEEAAHRLAADQFGIPEEDVSLLPNLPRWITDEVLQGEDKNEHEFDHTVIFVLPQKKLIKGEPTSEVFKSMIASNRPVWFKLKYDDQGITNKGSELTDWFRGVAPEDQDPPENVGLS